VLAIVLTHNAPRSLARFLDALGDQTRPPDRVLVVDNASEPPVEPPSPSIEVIRLDQNLGPAGGHAAGLSVFATCEDMTHAWVLDDDMIPDGDALDVLCDEAARRPGVILLPLIHDRLDNRRRRWPAWCGVLLPRAAVLDGGVPLGELFWWAEDTEYLQWRLPHLGWPTEWVDAAVVNHFRVRTTTSPPPWKLYYEARNSVYVRLWIKGQWWAPRRLVLTVLRLCAAALRAPTGRLRGLRLVLEGVADGLRGRLGVSMAVTAPEQPLVPSAQPAPKGAGGLGAGG
jgi:hypothetical protein